MFKLLFFSIFLVKSFASGTHTAGDEIEAILLSKNIKPIPKVAFGPDSLSLVQKYLSRNSAVILSGLHLWQSSEEAGIEKANLNVVSQWRVTGGERILSYESGEGLGRGAYYQFDTSNWAWPWRGSASFFEGGGTGFGSFASDESVRKVKMQLNTPQPVGGLHFDNECNFGAAVQVQGTKFYWTHNPYDMLTKFYENETEPDIHSQSAFGKEWLNTFYANNKMRGFSHPPLPGLEDTAGVLRKGEILFFPYWLPHSGVPLDGHSWSWNGSVKFPGDPWVLRTSLPQHLNLLCELRVDTGLATGPTTKVQPWDREWSHMAAELRKTPQRHQKVLERWQLEYRKRKCLEYDHGKNLGSLLLKRKEFMPAYPYAHVDEHAPDYNQEPNWRHTYRDPACSTLTVDEVELPFILGAPTLASPRVLRDREEL